MLNLESGARINTSERIALIGGGPAALLILKTMLDSELPNCSIYIYESGNQLGVGMPYSEKGAAHEHLSNVSADELPCLDLSFMDWLNGQASDFSNTFRIDRTTFHEKQVIPRLVLGRYLSDLFDSQIAKAKHLGITVVVKLNCRVQDLRVDNGTGQVVLTADEDESNFDRVLICTGHTWPKKFEDTIQGYYDSPYPPKKLAQNFDHEILLRGTSLTAIDAIRTLSRANGKFIYDGEGNAVNFQRHENSSRFFLTMVSRNGLLPAVRTHLEEPHVSARDLIPDERIQANMRANNGFLQLDFVFDVGFKEPLAKRAPKFYQRIKDLSLDQFVQKIMELRESTDPFELLKTEIAEAERSIREQESIHWKEMLSGLSFAMNYPAKYFSAEDMLRLKNVLMPLLSVIVAFLPQASCYELLALHSSGCLKIIDDDGTGEVHVKDGKITYEYENERGENNHIEVSTFVDCIGQASMKLEDFPFRTLINDGTVSRAFLEFNSRLQGQKVKAAGEECVSEIDGRYFLSVPGIAISDYFQVIDKNGDFSKQIYLIAVPFIGGYNPDYSGLDFCEQAAKLVVGELRNSRRNCEVARK